MSNIYNIEGIGRVEVLDTDYLGSGGEANIYVKDKMAIKIYHSPDKMIPVQKINELREIKDQRVLTPKHIVYKGSSDPVGYVMDYKPNSHPLCKVFNNAFKIRNQISEETINDLICQMQEGVNNIHSAKCLAVDLNEMNELISPKFANVFFIDVDSYATPSFHATAIMESIRDRLIKKNKWTEGSDWFSFAILIFQMWIGIHPYKGKHPEYKNSDLQKRMEDGVSVFNSEVVLPKACNDLSIIPKSHFGWLKDVFVNNARCAPPVMGDALIISVPQGFKFISSNKSFDCTLTESCEEIIKDVFNFMGINYLVGNNNIHKGKATIPIDISRVEKVFMCNSGSAEPIICTFKENIVRFYSENGMEFDNIAAEDLMVRNGCVYIVRSGELIECSVMRFGDRLVLSTKNTSSVMPLSTQVFNGVVIQDILGKKYFTMPFAKGQCLSIPIKELDGYRILGARSERNICGVLAEKSGIYYRAILAFDSKYSKYIIRITSGVSYSDINLTVLPNGVTVLANDSDVEIFKDENIKTIDNPPFDSTTKIFNISGIIHYVDGKEIYMARLNNKS